MKLNLKKYGWPMLALILFIVLLLCNWVHSFENISQDVPTGGSGGETTYPPGTEYPPTGGDWELCYTYDIDDSTMPMGTTQTYSIAPDTCTETSNELKFTFERWFMPSVDGCNGTVTWKVHDSNYWISRLTRTDSAEVNTFSEFGGTPDEVLGNEWDSNVPWRVIITNGFGCQIEYCFRINFYQWIAPGQAPVGDNPSTPGFELPLLLLGLIASLYILRKKDER